MRKFLLIALLFSINAQAKNNIGMLGVNFGAPTVNGKDNVYMPSVGEIIYDYSDGHFYGRDHLNAWISLSEKSGSPALPAGSILTFAGTTCPEGYLPADGRSLNEADYKDLSDAIGKAHGGGTGTFNLPDYRGRFLRGVDGTAGNDPDSAGRSAMNPGGNTGNNVGSIQNSALQNHTHYYYGAVGGGSALAPNAASGTLGPRSLTAESGNIATGTASTETRPKNAYVNYCIKI